MDHRDLTDHDDLITRARAARESARVAIEEAHETVARAHDFLKGLADKRRQNAATPPFASR